MSVQAILSCKLYKASPRKDKIRAALASPINVELVQQLREYLDDEYKGPKVPDVPESEIEPEVDDGGQVEDTGGSSAAPAGGGPAVDTGEAGPVDDKIDPEDAVPGEIRPEPEPEVKSSVASKGVSITGASSVPDELKGSLNMRQDTAGVERVSLKDNEIWIYYNDKMNLNTIMTPVIELLNAAAYSYLTFNRLARSENAIVFELSIDDTNAEVEPIAPVEDKK